MSIAKRRLKLLLPLLATNLAAWLLVLEGMPLRGRFYPFWGPILTLTLMIVTSATAFNGLVFLRYALRNRKIGSL